MQLTNIYLYIPYSIFYIHKPHFRSAAAIPLLCSKHKIYADDDDDGMILSSNMRTHSHRL